MNFDVGEWTIYTEPVAKAFFSHEWMVCSAIGLAFLIGILLCYVLMRGERKREEKRLNDEVTFDSIRKNVREEEVDDFNLGRVLIAVRKKIRR